MPTTGLALDVIETTTPPSADDIGAPSTHDEPGSPIGRLIGRITPPEMAIAAAIALVMLVLVVIEPNILEAPFQNERTLLFTFGGTAIAGLAYVAMLWFRVPAPVRIVLLLAPFLVVNWWLLSPYFVDDVVDETFETSITEQLAADDPATAAPAAPAAETPEAPATPVPVDDSTAADAGAPAAPIEDEPIVEEAAPPVDEAPPTPTGPVLLGAGAFVGLAGHDGTGDAGLFQNPDGSYTLRFENFDIENGPDLEVYLVPGADQVDLAEGSLHLGALKGNIGDQNYELPPGTELPPGEYTALVWCEAFSVEFVGATLTV